MVATLTLNPTITTNAPGSFSVTLDGFMQGMAMDDPAVRNELAGGVLAAAETIPMFGGIPISEAIGAGSPAGGNISRATAAANNNGWSVFNQNHAAISTPQSPVPQVLSGGLVNFYRYGSNARIPISADPALIATLAASNIIVPALYWDPVNQYITLVTTGGTWALPAGLRILSYNSGNSMVVVYASGTGFSTWNRAGNAVLLLI